MADVAKNTCESDRHKIKQLAEVLKEAQHTLGTIVDPKRQNLDFDDIKDWAENFFLPKARKALAAVEAQ